MTESELWEEDLSSIVWDQESVASAKSCSRLWRCHVNVAKQRLFSWSSQLPEDKKGRLQRIFLIAGVSKSRQLQFHLVAEKYLSEVPLEAKDLTSKHLYALSAGDLSQGALYAALSDASKEDPYLNSCSAIQNKKCVPRKNAKLTRHVKNPDFEPKKPLPPPKAASSQPRPSIPNEVKPSISQENVFPKQASPKKVTAMTGPAKKGSNQGGIAAMFAKTAVKPYKRPEKKEELSPGKENKLNEAKEEKQREQQLEENVKKRPKTTKLESQPKRKRIQMMVNSDSSEEDDTAEDDDLDRPPSEDECPPQAKLIESDPEDDEVIAATPKPTTCRPGRRRVRKYVNKTFVDAAGFTVTKKELQSCSETDSDAEKEADKKNKSSANSTLKAPAPKRAAQQPAAAAKAKEAKLKFGKVKQSSIASFFKK